MGLDMYLHAKKYVEKVNWSALQLNDELSYNSPEAIYPKWNDIVETAEMQDVATDIYGVNVEVTCAYWRKANQIHKWFVDNVQNGQDDCDSYYVSQNDLTELLSLCREAYMKGDPYLLPPQPGFFFGSYDIDEYYWNDIKNTITQIDKILKLPNLSELSFSYQSSW